MAARAYSASSANQLTKKQRYELLRAQLEKDRSSFIPHWRELNDFILPRRGRFLVTDVNRGDRRNQKIVDSTATFAARTLRSGMMSGVTSPARPWFRLTTPDPDLAEYGPVKEWLHIVGQRMHTIFLRANLYNVLPTTYGDLGVFGTAALAIMEDDESVIRCYSFPIGSYMLAIDHKLRVRVCIRDFTMTVRQLVERFGQRGRHGQPDWSRFSTAVRNLWERGTYDTPIEVCHVVSPNEEYDGGKLESRYKRFSSCYYERGGEQDRYLEESGFDEFPVLAPRWETTGEDVYGTDCPGMTALGDIKQLQLYAKRGAQALDKMVTPPMVAPSAMKTGKLSILPGEISYLDARDGQQGFRPAHEVRLSLAELTAEKNETRFMIRRAFFEDLFLMLAQSDRREITAREIDERHEEKLLALGPVLEQLNQDLLDPLIDRAFAIMQRQGLVPDPPDELQGMPLKVEYLSIMAQAQKMVGLAGLEHFAGFVGQIAKVDPSVLDKVDRDQMVDEYGAMTGVPPRLIVPDEQVAAIRQARAEAQKAQQQAALMAQNAESAKTLSETDTQKPSALQDVMAAMTGNNMASGMPA